MKISIRKSKHQEQELTADQFRFAAQCVELYMKNSLGKYMSYEGGAYKNINLSCDVYQTKTTISAIVYFKD